MNAGDDRSSTLSMAANQHGQMDFVQFLTNGSHRERGRHHPTPFVALKRNVVAHLSRRRGLGYTCLVRTAPAEHGQPTLGWYGKPLRRSPIPDPATYRAVPSVTNYISNRRQADPPIQVSGRAPVWSRSMHRQEEET